MIPLASSAVRAVVACAVIFFPDRETRISIIKRLPQREFKYCNLLIGLKVPIDLL